MKKQVSAAPSHRKQTPTTGGSKLLFSLEQPLRAKVYRASFRPYAATEFIDTRALKTVDKAIIECGSIEVAGKCVTLVAEICNGIITEIKPKACNCCSPKKGKKAAPKSATKALIEKVNQELVRRKIPQPEWPIGSVARASLGFRIPIGPIIIIIGTDPDEGIDTFDICIVINIGTESCIYCLLRPSACVDLPGPL